MGEPTHIPFSREELDKINERIRELTAKVDVCAPEHFVGTQEPLPQSMMNDIKELRRLRRIRDNGNIDND